MRSHVLQRKVGLLAGGSQGFARRLRGGGAGGFVVTRHVKHAHAAGAGGAQEGVEAAGRRELVNASDRCTRFRAHLKSSISSGATNTSPHLQGCLKHLPSPSYNMTSISTVSLADAPPLLPVWLRCHCCSFAESLTISKAFCKRENADASPPLSGCSCSRGGWGGSENYARRGQGQGRSSA